MITRVAKRLTKRLLIASGFQSMRESRASSPVVLVYHGVSRHPGPTADASFVGWRDFREHLRFLCRSRKVVPVGLLASTCATGQRIDPRWIAITVDDGLADSCQLIAEEAAALSLPWNLNVPVGLIGTDRTIWSQEARILAKVFAADVEAVSAETGVPLGSGAGRLDALVAALMRVQDSTRASWFSLLEARLGLSRICGAIGAEKHYRILTASELRQLAVAGVDIGVHGMQHEPLNEQASPSTLEREIVAARTALMAMLDARPAAFAFPFGAECDRARRDVAAAGFEYGLRSAHQAVHPMRGCFPFLPRIPGEWSLTDLRFILAALS